MINSIRIKQLLVVISFVFLMSCNQSQPATDGESTATVDPVLAMQAALQATMAADEAARGDEAAHQLDNLEEAEARWASAGIEKYRLSVLYVNSIKAIIQRHTIVVDGGEIVEQNVACGEQNPNCIIAQIDLENITVPGLFGMSRTALLNDELNQNGADFNFDPVHGVPEWIPLKSSNLGPMYWHIESFDNLD